MGKFNKHQKDRERFCKCEICLETIPVQYYFSIGDTIVCHECGTEYILESKNPLKLTMAEHYDDSDDFTEDLYFED